MAPGEILGLGLLPTAFIAVSGGKLIVNRRLMRRGRRTRGVVVAQTSDAGPPVAFEESEDPAGENQPVVEFFVDGGQRVRVTTSVRSTYTGFVPGRMVDVVYDPRDPRKAAIAGQEEPLLRLFLALGLAGWAVLLLATTFSGLLPDALKENGWVVIPLMVGVSFLGVAVAGCRTPWRLRRHGVRTNGIVVGETHTTGQSELTRHHPVVSYPGPDGRPIQAPSAYGTLRTRYWPGTQVALRYDPDDPYRMRLVDDPVEPGYWIFGLAGLLITTVGTVIAWRVLA